MKNKLSLLVLLALFVILSTGCAKKESTERKRSATSDFPISISNSKGPEIVVEVYKLGTTDVLVEPQYSKIYGKVTAIWVTVVSRRTVGTPIEGKADGKDFVFNNVTLALQKITKDDGTEFIDSFNHVYLLQEGDPLSDWEKSQTKLAQELPGTLPPTLEGTIRWFAKNNSLIFAENNTSRRWKRLIKH